VQSWVATGHAAWGVIWADGRGVASSGYDTRARAEAATDRLEQVIGDGLRSRTDERRATEVAVAVHALNRMLDLGRPTSAAAPQSPIRA